MWLLLLFACAGPVDPARPFPQHVVYPGLETSLSGSVDAHDAALQEYFSVWERRFLAEAPPTDGDSRFRVLFDDAGATVSEGQGYGMVVTATLGDRDRFDGLWRFSRDHPSRLDPRLMDWYVPADESSDGDDDDSAFDGDADIAFGLLLAEAQWGSDGDVDYHAAAVDVLAGLAGSVVGAESHLPLLGDWIQEADPPYDPWDLRTSDVMPASFAVFAQVDPVWAEVRTASLQACSQIAAQLAPATGLLPDFAQDGQDGLWASAPDYLEADTDDDWSYNAVRDPWRLGFAALAFDDPEARELATRMSAWMDAHVAGDPTAIQGGYALDGTDLPDSDYFDPLFAATFGPAAMADPDGQEWLDAIWEAVSTEHVDYFSDTVTLQAMLVMTGNAWVPGT